MAEINEIVKLGVDAYHGTTSKYSQGESLETLRKALVAANNNSTTLDYKAIRDGKCAGLFSIVEEILSRTVVEGFQGNEYFNALVDFRNVAAGDQNSFIIEDSDLFTVSEVAGGVMNARRQRIAGAKTVKIDTSYKMIRIYEELNRVLSGQIDFNKMIELVGKSWQKNMLNEIYTLWDNATSANLGGTTYFPAAGSYSADTLLDLIAHVEAAAGGKPATIIGSKKAARKLTEAVQSDSAKEELHSFGVYGKFYGTPIVVTPQLHKPNTTDFVYNDNKLTIVAGDEKPIKFVYEGQSTIVMPEPTAHADLTNEYMYLEKYGMGLVLACGNAGIGKYQMT